MFDSKLICKNLRMWKNKDNKCTRKCWVILDKWSNWKQKCVISFRPPEQERN